MKKLLLLLSMFSLAAVADDAVKPLSDVEVWNAGVDAYRAGDVTNALTLLRPLILTKEHGAKAAEVVAKLARERAGAVGEEEALALLEESAAAAQIALRAHPREAKANRNFTRATDGLREVRERAHVAAVLKAAQGRDPGGMLETAMVSARQLLAESGTYLTNVPERVVALADALSARAAKLADTWIPVREAIVQAVTNEQEAATILARIEAAQAKTRDAARQFGDLDPAAYSSMSEVEQDFTQFFKLVALPPAALRADRLAQSYAWLDVETVNGRAWQPEALDFTRAFRARFPAWARAYEQSAQADTNAEPFTVEAQAKVSALATELEKLQLECTEKILPPQQEKALEIIREIEELLPRQKNGGGGQSGQPQANKQPQDQQQQPQENQQQNPQPEQDSQSDESAGEQEEEPPEAEAGEGEVSEADKGDKEVEALLKAAQERNDEHEADKKARMRKAPLPPNERDW